MITVLTSILLWLTASSQAAPPGWFTSGTHPRYQTEFYFVGVGSGENYDAAIEAASEQIARQIEVTIENEITNVVSSHAVDDKETITSEYKSIGKSYAKASLKGAEVSEKVTSGNTYYALVTIEKDKYATGLLVELDRMHSELQKQYQDSEEMLDSGKIIPAIKVLMETGDTAAQFETRAILYSSITGKQYNTDDVTSSAAILSQIHKIISRIKIEKTSGDNQTAMNGRLLPEPLSVRVFMKQKGDAIPLSDLQLCLDDIDGNKLEQQNTDSEGYVSFWHNAVGDDKGKATIAFDLKMIPAMFKRDFKTIQTTFRYNISPTPSMTFSVHVMDEEGAPVEDIEQIVSGSVQKAGHHINENGDFLLSGKVILTDSKMVDGIDGAQYLVSVKLPLSITEKKSGDRIGSIDLTGKGMDKKSEKGAKEKAYKKLNVPKREFQKTLANASVKLKPLLEKSSQNALMEGKKLYELGEYQRALKQLAIVTDGEDNVRESDALIKEIKQRIAENSDK
ncbi:LPP20 family lipoprotein [bacterium]|nr:LPP20 family lipoprotein [bacterium]